MRPRPAWLIVPVSMAAAIVGLALLGWPASEYRDGDYFQFRAGARAVLEGASPYDAAWWIEFHAREGSQALLQPPLRGSVEWTTPYPLWTFLVLIPIGAMPLGLSAASWLVCQLAGVAIAVSSLARVLALATDRRALVLLAAIVVAFEPVWFLVFGGNVTGFVFTAFGLSVAAALAGHYRIAGALLAFVMIKPQSFLISAPAFLFGLPTEARRPFLLGAAALALPLGAASFAVQPGWFGEWVTSALALQSSEYSNATGWTLGRAVGGRILSITVVGAAVAALAAWWRLRRPAFATLIAAATPISVFIAPHGWTHEHLYLLVPAVIVLASGAALAQSARSTTFIALAALVVVLPWALLVRPRSGEELSAVVPLGCFALVLWVDAQARGGRHLDTESQGIGSKLECPAQVRSKR